MAAEAWRGGAVLFCNYPAVRLIYERNLLNKDG